MGSMYSAFGPALRDPNALSKPRGVGISIGSETWRARRPGAETEHRGEIPDRLFNQRLLMLFRQESGVRFFRVPVLVTNPGHPPKNVRCFRLPEQSQLLCAIGVLSKRILNRDRAEMIYSVQPRVKNAPLTSIPISFQKPRP